MDVSIPKLVLDDRVYGSLKDELIHDRIVLGVLDRRQAKALLSEARKQRGSSQR